MDGVPQTKCSSQECDACKLKDIFSFENFDRLFPFELDPEATTVHYQTTKQAREIKRPDEKPKMYFYQKTTPSDLPLKEAIARLFTHHPDRKEPYAATFLSHRAKVQWDLDTLQYLTNRENPGLPFGTAIIGVDFIESPHYEFAQSGKIGGQIYEKQPILLATVPCLFTVPKNGGGSRIVLIQLNFVSDDSKHSSNRVLQILELGFEYIKKYMKERYG